MKKLKVKIEFDCLANKVTEKDISEDNGFFDEDIKEIKDLSVGQKHDINGVLESMSVYRYN